MDEGGTIVRTIKKNRKGRMISIDFPVIFLWISCDKSLTLSAYLVLQQLSLFQTARAYFTKCTKTLNTFVETFSRQIVFFWFAISSFFLSCVSSTNRIFSRTNNLTIQTRTTILENKYSYPNAVKRSINTSSTPWIILINENRLRLYS